MHFKGHMRPILSTRPLVRWNLKELIFFQVSLVKADRKINWLLEYKTLTIIDGHNNNIKGLKSKQN